MLVPAFATHVCLGAPYGWSSISAQLAREGGIVASCSSDWSLDATTWPMAIMIASGGISAALLGSWTVRVGVRQAMASGAVMFGLGLSVAGLGVSNHSLPLLYTGNVLCGIGYGCAYTPPLQVDQKNEGVVVAINRVPRPCWTGFLIVVVWPAASSLLALAAEPLPLHLLCKIFARGGEIIIS